MTVPHEVGAVIEHTLTCSGCRTVETTRLRFIPGSEPPVPNAPGWRWFGDLLLCHQCSTPAMKAVWDKLKELRP